MKKIYKLMALSMLVLGLAACKKEEAPELTADDIKITTTAVTNITAESAVTGGNITDAGGNTITKRGVCWGDTADPTIKGGKVTEDGSGTGVFTSTISGLEPGKSYHVRAYAICQAGIAYGNDVTFSVPVFEPTVKTNLPTNLGIDFAVVGGQVLNKMGGTITEVGVLFGTATNPTTKAAAAEVADKFSVELNGLVPDTQYYVKAYAINEAGTGYGEEITFTTSADPIISVVDENFQAYLEYEFGDDNGDLHKSVADTITTMHIENQGIKTLEGIKQFPALKVLIANHNPLENIDVAGMANLELFDIAFNGKPITNLDLTGCTSLTHFWANDPADATGLESFTFELPALQELYLSLWHNVKTLDVTKSPNLRVLSACQMYVLEKLDLTHSNVLNYVWIPDIFACTELKVASDALDYLGMWNAQVLTSLDISACPNIREFQATDCFEVAELKQSFGSALQKINVNCWRKLKALDLSACVNLVEANLIQLFECESLVMPTNCSHMTYLWLADALKAKELSITNIPNGARIMMWGNSALETLTYTTNQEIIGWNWNDNLEMCDEGAFPGNNIKHFNITAPNAKKIWFNNANKLESLDLSASTVLEEFRGHQMNTVASVTFASPELRFVYMPGAYALTSLDLTCTQKLAQLQMWACSKVTTLKINSPALWEINICNLGELVTFDANIPNIQFFFVNGCQKLPNVDLTNHTALKTFEGNWTKAMTVMDFTGCTALERVYFPDSNVATMTFSNNPNCKTVQGWACHNLGPDLDLRGCADAMTELNIGTGDAANANLNRVILRVGQEIATIFKRDATEVVHM